MLPFGKPTVYAIVYLAVFFNSRIKVFSEVGKVNYFSFFNVAPLKGIDDVAIEKYVSKYFAKVEDARLPVAAGLSPFQVLKTRRGIDATKYSTLSSRCRFLFKHRRRP